MGLSGVRKEMWIFSLHLSLENFFLREANFLVVECCTILDTKCTHTSLFVLHSWHQIEIDGGLESNLSFVVTENLK